MDAAIWETEHAGTIELAERAQTMVQHILLQDRLRHNQEEYTKRIAQGQEACNARTATKQAQQTEKEWEEMKASWADKLTVHADCMSLIHATSRAGASL
jgi:hypothetical protein